jgi:AcrR family transcriptional regulator
MASRLDGVSLSRQSDYLKSECCGSVAAYTVEVPRLWNDTIQAHRTAVRDAILDTTAALVAEHGLLSVTMSKIAEATGIGRATLYKYFPDVEAILFAWHERQITAHLAQLEELRDQAGDAGQRLEAVLEAYALISHERFSHEHPGPELAALLHRGAHLTRAQQHVHDLIKDLLAEVAATGNLRDDVAPDELARYCVHALGAASSLPSKASVRRLVTVTLAGLRPPR